jgi:CheY-like chemotaxis protein
MASRCILIVDDDDSLRRVLADLFRDEEYVVRLAANGRQALTTLARKAFDVLLLDVAMPVMGGLELARALRAQGNTVPIILMSASGGLAEAARAVAAQAYVQKPFEISLLISTIELVSRGTSA